MRSDVGSNDSVSINVERDAQIALNHYRIDCFAKNGGQRIDFMGTQAWIKRVFFKNRPKTAN